jgi:hypothetical protein
LLSRSQLPQRENAREREAMNMRRERENKIATHSNANSTLQAVASMQFNIVQIMEARKRAV